MTFVEQVTNLKSRPNRLTSKPLFQLTEILRIFRMVGKPDAKEKNTVIVSWQPF